MKNEWWRKRKPRCGVGEERCPRCGKRFKTKQGVEDHMNEIHGGRPQLRMQLIVERIRLEREAQQGDE